MFLASLLIFTCAAASSLQKHSSDFAEWQQMADSKLHRLTPFKRIYGHAYWDDEKKTVFIDAAISAALKDVNWRIYPGQRDYIVLPNDRFGTTSPGHITFEPIDPTATVNAAFQLEQCCVFTTTNEEYMEVDGERSDNFEKVMNLFPDHKPLWSGYKE